jgi:hypothetical protein
VTIVNVGFSVVLGVKVGLGVTLGVKVAVGMGGSESCVPSSSVVPARQLPSISTFTETPRCAARSLNLSPGWTVYNCHPWGTAQRAKVGVGVTMIGLDVGGGVELGTPGSGVSSNTGSVSVGWAVGITGTKPSVIPARIAPITMRLVIMPAIKPIDTSFRLFMTRQEWLRPSG